MNTFLNTVKGNLKVETSDKVSTSMIHVPSLIITGQPVQKLLEKGLG